MIVTFKQYPELGRLRLAEGGNCSRCVFYDLHDACESQTHKTKRDDEMHSNWACIVGNHHYEPAPPRTEPT